MRTSRTLLTGITGLLAVALLASGFATAEPAAAEQDQAAEIELYTTDVLRRFISEAPALDRLDQLADPLSAALDSTMERAHAQTVLSAILDRHAESTSQYQTSPADARSLQKTAVDQLSAIAGGGGYKHDDRVVLFVSGVSRLDATFVANALNLAADSGYLAEFSSELAMPSSLEHISESLQHAGAYFAVSPGSISLADESAVLMMLALGMNDIFGLLVGLVMVFAGAVAIGVCVLGIAVCAPAGSAIVLVSGGVATILGGSYLIVSSLDGGVRCSFSATASSGVTPGFTVGSSSWPMQTSTRLSDCDSTLPSGTGLLIELLGEDPTIGPGSQRVLGYNSVNCPMQRLCETHFSKSNVQLNGNTECFRGQGTVFFPNFTYAVTSSAAYCYSR